MLLGMSFGNVAAQDVKPGKTIKIQLNQLKGAPVFEVEHAGESNIGYWNEMLADARGALELGDDEGYDAARQAERLQRLRGRFARHVVRSLERVFHDDGTAATTDDIPAVVDALPRHVFLELVRVCRNARNFVDAGSAPSAAPAAVATKSPPA